MANFFYRVKDETGKTFSGIVEADTIKNAKNKLRTSGYYIVNIQLYKDKGRLPLFKAKVGIETILVFTHQLSSIVGAGVPILMSLEIIWRQIENVKMQLVISQLQNMLKSGRSLAESAAEFPNIFPPMYIALLNVAETGGGLVNVLKKLGEYLENQRQFITKVNKAVTYPIIVVIFAIVVLIVMLVKVVPVFKKVFTQIKMELPVITKFVVRLSDMMCSLYFWLSVAVLAVALFFIYKMIKSSQKLSLKMDRIKLTLPIFGKIFHTAAISRFSRSLGMLLGSGLPASNSIELAKATVTNKYIENKLEWVERRILEGIFLDQAFREAGIFPAFFVEMVSIGEKSGTLVEMLEKISNHFEEELDYRINKFLTLLEPMLIMFVGVIVIVILLAIYSPIFAVWQGISQR